MYVRRMNSRDRVCRDIYSSVQPVWEVQVSPSDDPHLQLTPTSWRCAPIGRPAIFPALMIMG